MKHVVRIKSKVIQKLKINKLKIFVQYMCATPKYVLPLDEAYRKIEQLSMMPKSSAITKNEIRTPKCDLTIIIPIYNSEKWIEECLDSVLHQKTAYTFQIIAVNDGSTDHTAEILNRYSSYPNLKIIHQENRGYSGARNVALKVISSRYILFLDSDDILVSGAIDALLSTAYKNQADVVEGSAYAFNEKGRLYDIKKDDCFHTRENLWGGPCFKVIKSELFEKIEFPEGYLYEDTIIAYLIYPQAKVISTISEFVYGYRIHDSSITRAQKHDYKHLDSYWIMLLMHRNMKELGIKVDYNMYCLTMKHIVITFLRTNLLEEEVKQDIFILIKDFIEKNYNSYFECKDRYYRLSLSLRKSQYDRYCILCKNHSLTDRE